MRYLLWALKFALFAVAVTFAIKNTDAVAVRYFLGYEWRAPLILVLFVFLCLGAVLGFLGAFVFSIAIHMVGAVGEDKQRTEDLLARRRRWRTRRAARASCR